jgi:uncharacterized repeat protein (TIGR03803 family)
MRTSALSGFVLSFNAAAALLAGCGGSQTATGAVPQSRSIGGPSYEIIYSFQGGNDAELPYSQDAPLTYSGGVFYGMAAGGTTGEGCGVSCGTAFEVTPTGSESVLYVFKGEPDSGNPFGPLIVVDGSMYGVGASGGTHGDGTIYTLDSSGNERVVYSFKGGKDGSFPEGPLTLFSGELYGTTVDGGADNLGTVFAVTTSGKEHVLHSFRYRHDGAHPAGGVIVLDGELYGTTYDGGTYGFGTVFAVSASDKEHVVYNFEYGNDGAAPGAPLTAVGVNLYGTTTDGGGSGYNGTVFEVTPSGTERVLHRFSENLIDGQFPETVLVYRSGKFYGTTLLGGKYGDGTVFVMSKSGAKERLLHSFAGVPDGRYPTGGLAAIGSVFYGTTNEGGTGSCPYGDGCGTVFALHP